MLESSSSHSSSSAVPASKPAPKHPLRPRVESLEVLGVRTEIFVCEFLDRVLVIATQRGGVGTLVMASRDANAPRGSEASFQVAVALGDRNDVMAQLIARQLVADVSATSSRSVVLGVAFRERPASPETARAVLQAILNVKTWRGASGHPSASASGGASASVTTTDSAE